MTKQVVSAVFSCLVHRSTPFFFFNDTATTEIYTLSLHDALPILRPPRSRTAFAQVRSRDWAPPRSEEHTSELQSRQYLVCRLLLEKKNKSLKGCSWLHGTSWK